MRFWGDLRRHFIEARPGRGGQTIGTTDEFGLRAIERPAHVNDIHASILHLLGLNHLQLTYQNHGRAERPTILGGEHMVKELWGG